MPIKRIVLKYPSAPTETYYTEEHMYVALDSGSGGYPVRSTILNAHDFKTLEAAQKYVGQFEEFKPVELSIEVQEKPLA
ncbi:hypothetical protein KZ843_06765 [Pseudomonas aeruginosa]|nr:hypothetical protein [Pseudomonas aeruginosa]MBW6122594.1 hypothetical protein [Pseudomonas aeruginosa]